MNDNKIIMLLLKNKEIQDRVKQRLLHRKQAEHSHNRFYKKGRIDKYNLK